MNHERQAQIRRNIAEAEVTLREIQKVENELRAKPDAFEAERMKKLFESNADALAATRAIITALRTELEQLERPSSN